MDGHSLLAWLVIGIVAGWLAGVLVKGGGFGLIGDLVVGVVGAFVGGWVSRYVPIHLGTGWIGTIVWATLGAVLLLLIIRLVRRAA